MKKGFNILTFQPPNIPGRHDNVLVGKMLKAFSYCLAFLSSKGMASTVAWLTIPETVMIVNSLGARE